MRKLLILIAFLSLSACKQPPSALPSAQEKTAEIAVTSNTDATNEAIARAFEQKKSHIFVQGLGKVKKLLPDDNKGLRHQKFLVEISAKQVLLFAHNTDLAQRVDGLQVGDMLEFKGEYVYNPKGGILHWTHHDPDGGNKAGWIKYNGKIYQ